MKRSISLVLCLTILLSVFSVFGVAASAVDASSLFTVKSSGFKSGKVTYTVYLNSGVSLCGAVIKADFDPNVLEVVTDSDGGAYMVKDSYGDKVANVSGEYVAGLEDGSNSRYSIGFVNMRDVSYTSNRAFMKVSFKVKDNSYPTTTVKFYCDQLESIGNPTINITKGSNRSVASLSTSTMDITTLSGISQTSTGLKISWKATAGAKGYRVYKKVNGSYQKLTDVSASETSYTDGDVKQGTTYQYTVRAFNYDSKGNVVLNSGYDSTGVSKKYSIGTPTITLANATTGVNISWGEITGAAYYRVYRKLPGETSYTKLADVTGTAYTDTKAPNNKKITYTVKAFDSLKNYGSYTGVSITYLKAPTVTIANASTGVKVSWNKISGASKYYVYRKASGEKSWTRLTDSATGTSYTDTKAKSGTTYYYTVKAVSGSVASAFKSSSALKYLAQPKVSSLSNTNSGITVKWGKITGASGYTVYRKASGDKSWTNLGNTTGTSFTDTKAKAGTTYYYTVKAYNGSVKSTFTSSTAVRRLTTPSLKSVTSAKSGITFKWNKVTGAEGYYVYRKTGSGDWKKIATVKSGSTVSYLDKTAKKGTTYTYTVRAYYSNSSVSYFNTTGLTIKDKY